MSTTKDTDRVITIPMTTPDALVTLHDAMYASVCASTGSPRRDTHRVRIDVKGDEVNLHFENVYIALSLADWNRVAQAVAGIVSASAVSE